MLDVKEGTTEQFAKQNFVKTQTILKQHCEKGAYQGIRPLRKLPNGRLVWPLETPQENKEVA